MSETIDYLKMFATFPLALRRFARHRLTLEDARRIVRERMEQRDANFLRIAERSIYGRPRSPYLGLLRMAGCELGDLRGLVKQKGLEGTLKALRDEGVYVTFEEFKGRKPIVRRNRTIPASARDFDNPSARGAFSLQTGGSTGLASAVYQDLDYIAAGAPQHMLMLDAWGAVDTPALHWMGILPSGGLRFILQRACFARRPVRWLTPNAWFDSAYWLKYGLATLYMIGSMRAAGIRVPVPEVVTLDRAAVVAHRLRDIIRTHGRCLLYSNVSRALRVCVAAEQADLDLSGATLRIGGEPITAVKIERMERVGARVLPTYGAIETGGIGLGCADAAEPGQVHLVKDAFALITHPHPVESGTSVPAFNLTSLVATSSKVMLNYQIDDYGTIEERVCGCALHACGYTTQIHAVRSYGKLVGEGVTLVGTDLLRILEQVLPARFGGSPLDYQLMQSEDTAGLTRLNLVISPRVEIPSEEHVIDVVLSALRESSPTGDAAGNVWRRAGTLQVVRTEPLWTSRGKLPSFYVERPTEHP